MFSVAMLSIDGNAITVYLLVLLYFLQKIASMMIRHCERSEAISLNSNFILE